MNTLKYEVYQNDERLIASFKKIEAAKDYLDYLSTVGISDSCVKSAETDKPAFQMDGYILIIRNDYEAIDKSTNLSDFNKILKYSGLMTQLENLFGWEQTLFIQTPANLNTKDHTLLYLEIKSSRDLLIEKIELNNAK